MSRWVPGGLPIPVGLVPGLDGQGLGRTHRAVWGGPQRSGWPERVVPLQEMALTILQGHVQMQRYTDMYQKEEKEERRVREGVEEREMNAEVKPA